MKYFSYQNWLPLVDERSGPCVSVYAPLNSSFKAQVDDPSKFQSLLGSARNSFSENGFSGDKAVSILDPIVRFEWSRIAPHFSSRSIAFFTSQKTSAYTIIPGCKLSLSVVSDSFHIKPMIPEASRSLLPILLAEYRRARRGGQSEERLERVARLAVEGKVRSLYLDKSRPMWGYLNPKTGDVRIKRRIERLEDEDIIDNLAETVIQQGGRVIGLPKCSMPSLSPVAAIVSGASRAVSQLNNYFPRSSLTPSPLASPIALSL